VEVWQPLARRLGAVVLVFRAQLHPIKRQCASPRCKCLLGKSGTLEGAVPTGCRG
jgi:hypothetical protein